MRRKARPATSAGLPVRASAASAGRAARHRPVPGDACGDTDRVARQATEPVGQEADGRGQGRQGEQRAGVRAPAARPPRTRPRRGAGTGRRGGGGPGALPRSRRRRGAPGTRRASPARRARPCWRGRSGRPIPRPPGATPGPRPRPRARPRRTGRVRLSPPPAPPGLRSARTKWARPGAPDLRTPPGPARSARVRSDPAPGAAGAPAGPRVAPPHATTGSSKWPSNGSSHPGLGTQSESMKATRAVSTTAKPGVAGAGGPGVVAQGDEARPVALGDLLGAAGLGRRVVHHHAGQVGERAEQPVELRRPVPHGHHDRDVVQSEGSVSPGAGRRPQTTPAVAPRAARPVARPRGARPPPLQQRAGPGRDPEQAKRAATEHHRPAIEVHRCWGFVQREGAWKGRRPPIGRGRERRRPVGCRWAERTPNLGSGRRG